jgi:hypothetical protein
VVRKEEENPMFNFIHKTKEKIEMTIIAWLIERVFKNWITTVLGVLLGFAGVVAAVYNLIPATLVWQGHNVANTLLAAAGVAVTLAGLIAKDKNIGINTPTLPTKVGMILLMLSVGALMPMTVHAQDTTDSATITVTTSTDAVVVFQNGNKDAATLISATIPFATFGKTSGNVLYLTTQNLLDPSYASTYAAGAAYKPDLSGFFKKYTVFPADTFTITVGAAVGNKIPVSGSNSHVAGLFNARASYRASSKLSWNVVQYIAQVSPTGVDHGLCTGIAAHF